MFHLPAELNDLPAPSRRALVWSQWDGILFCVMDGLAGAASPALGLYALALGMPPLAIGLLASLPMFAGSLAQAFSPGLERLCGSRKRAVVLGGLAQVLSWLMVPAVAGLPPGLGRQAALVGIVAAGTVGWFITVPSWSSWMGDLIPATFRARVFAWRLMPAYAVTALSLLGMGFWMQAHEGRGGDPRILIGAFQGLFLAAAAARLLSVVCLVMQHEPPLGASEPPGAAGPRDVAAGGFARVVAFFGFFHLMLYVAAPYFGPYMRLAGLDYFHIALILAVTWPAKMLFLPAWQRAASRYGNRRVVLLSALMTSVLPWLWMVSMDWRYLVGVMVLNGMVWAGLELCELPYLLDITAPAERTRKLATYFSFRSLCDCLGAVGGDGVMRGYRQAHPIGTAGGPYQWVLFVSGLGRVAALLWAWRRLPEPHPDPAKGRTRRILAEVLLRR